MDALHKRIRELEARVARLEKQRLALATQLMDIAPDASGARYCGCYVLYRDGQPLYVGQSANVFGRVAHQHRGGSYAPMPKDDEVRIFWCDESELNALERRLIEELHPAHNSEGVIRPYMARRPRRQTPAEVYGPEFVSYHVGKEHGHA